MVMLGVKKTCVLGLAPGLAAVMAAFAASGATALRVRPDGTADMTKAFAAAVGSLKASGGGTIDCEPGEYHFFATSATPFAGCHVSNHDHVDPLLVGLPLAGVTNVTVRGNGSVFVFHGGMTACAIVDSENVRLEDIGFDWSRPFCTEAKVVGYEGGRTRVSIDAGTFPYAVSNGWFVGVGDCSLRMSVERTMAFRGDTHALVERTRDIRYRGRICGRGDDGTLLLDHDFSKDGAGVRVGDVLAFRPLDRPYPVIFGYRSKNTALQDVRVHTGWGMGAIFQRCENVVWRGTGEPGERRAGVFARPGAGHFTTLHADASHFSNVKGEVLVENAFFEGMMDDAINVHATCPAIAEVLAPTRIRCRCMRDDGMGFDLFLAGETLRYIKGATFEYGAEAKVVAVRRLSVREFELDLDAPVPPGIAAGDAVENADWHPSVTFRRNVVGRNRARGSLFTTPRPVLVESNLFDRVSGSAILFSGDAKWWYESGSCRNVLVRGYTFRNCMTSRFGHCNGVISICPEVKDIAAQKRRCHGGIVIEDNVFETFDAPVLYAYSAGGVLFRRNEIRLNSDFPSWGEPRFMESYSENVKIE
jgi:hypothetical protein